MTAQLQSVVCTLRTFFFNFVLFLFVFFCRYRRKSQNILYPTGLGIVRLCTNKRVSAPPYDEAGGVGVGVAGPHGQQDRQLGISAMTCLEQAPLCLPSDLPTDLRASGSGSPPTPLT